MASDNTVWDFAVVATGLAESGAVDMDVHALNQGYLSGLRQHGGQLRCDAEVASLQRQRIVKPCLLRALQQPSAPKACLSGWF